MPTWTPEMKEKARKTRLKNARLKKQAAATESRLAIAARAAGKGDEIERLHQTIERSSGSMDVSQMAEFFVAVVDAARKTKPRQ